MLKHGMVIYDALYTWCSSLQAETHNWTLGQLGLEGVEEQQIHLA